MSQGGAAVADFLNGETGIAFWVVPNNPIARAIPGAMPAAEAEELEGAVNVVAALDVTGGGGLSVAGGSFRQ